MKKVFNSFKWIPMSSLTFDPEMCATGRECDQTKKNSTTTIHRWSTYYSYIQIVSY